MNDLKVIDNKLIPIYEGRKDEKLVDAKELHDFLGIKKYFTQWIAPYTKTNNAYGFEENGDFTWINAEVNPTNGLPIKDCILTLDTAKEISMLSKTPKGKQARQYFIKVEKEFNKLKDNELKRIAQREAGKIVRNMLTDTIRDKIPDSPHKKFTYPNYTRLIYKILFDKTTAQLREERKVPKSKTLRDFFNPDELKEIQQLENIITGLISLGMGYEEIKNMLNQRYLKKIA